MRKNTARHWLHACLDLLPVLLIPVFMIYSHRHSLTERTEVDIQYKYESNEVNTLNDLVLGNVYHADNLEIFTSGWGDFTINVLSGSCSFNGSENIEEYYFIDYDVNNGNYITIYNDDNYGYIYIAFSNENAYVDMSLEDSPHCYLTNVDFYIVENLSNFISHCNNEGYPITESTFNVIESVEEVHDTVIYNDTDIGSQFMYSLYHVTDKYFNMNDTFNLGSVYEWFSTNIFGGNPPLAVPIVWNVIIYEFIMDMLFLLYGVFMFLIDFIESLMDRVFSKTRNGGR